MGTNFYWIANPEKEDEDEPAIHIGKRSAAGPFCWDCMKSLCKNGEQGVHKGSAFEDNFHKKCPFCGKSKRDAGYSAAMVELGFADATMEKPSGVSTCSSWTWTLRTHLPRLEEYEAKKSRKKVVRDEYGRKFTAQEFLAMVRCCPIVFYSPYRFS